MEKIELGDLVEDRITKVRGIVIAHTSWLFGCQRLTIQPKEPRDGKPMDTICIDVPQAQLIQKNPHHFVIPYIESSGFVDNPTPVQKKRLGRPRKQKQFNKHPGGPDLHAIVRRDDPRRA